MAPLVPKPRYYKKVNYHFSHKSPKCTDCKHSLTRSDGQVFCRLFDMGNKYYSDYIPAKTARVNEDLCGEFALHFMPKNLTKDYISLDEWW
jgi:hypothetical protein